MQAGPVELLGQALEVGRGGDQHRIGTGQRAHQIFVEEAPGLDRTAGSQRPQHAEQQAIDMLVGHGAMHLGAVQLGAERGLQRIDLARQLVQPLADGAGLAGAAGGEHAQFAGALVQWQQRRIVGIVGSGLQGLVIGRQVTCKTTHLRLQRLQCRGQVVGGQEHPFAGVPGTEQRRSEGHGIIEVKRPVAACGSAESVMPGQYAQAEGSVVDGDAIADTDVAAGLRRDQQPIQGDPVSHARALP
ncbi:hypothetical protein D3C73_892820 [compost metagenome]